MMTFDITIAQRIDEIGQTVWDAIGAAQPFTSYRWLRFAETLTPDVQPIYILLHDRGEPVARAIFAVAHREVVPVGSRLVQQVIEAALRRYPVLICRAPLSSATGLWLTTDRRRQPARDQLAQLALDYSSQIQASFVVFDYLDVSECDGWSDQFRVYTFAEPGTQLAIAWDSFDAYIRGLGKSAYKDYRRHTNRADEAGIVVKRHTTVTRRDEAVALIRATEAHHDAPPNPFVEPMLAHSDLIDAHWLTAELDGRLVGAGLLVGDRGTQTLALIGLDYEVRWAYFQLFYAAIRAAIESGTHTLYGGTHVYELKERLGFVRQTNPQIVFSIKHPLLRGVVNRLLAG